MPITELSPAEKELFEILEAEAKHRFGLEKVPITSCSLENHYGEYGLQVEYESSYEPPKREAYFEIAYSNGMVAPYIPLRPDAMIKIANWYKKHG